MIRFGFSVLTILAATAGGALAQSPVERGSYLVNTVLTCGNCHTPKGPGGDVMDKAFSGGLTFDEPPFKVTASNITPDKETGIGNWSADQIKKLMLTGVRPNGVPVAPIMPTGFYGILTPSDLNAVVAYLQSLKPIRNEVPAPVYNVPIAQEKFPGAEKPMAASDLNNKVKRGFYLATIAHCMECHTPMEKGKHQFDSRQGVGGQKFPGPWGESTARNITSHKTAGIGGWTDAEIKRAITQGVRKDGTRLKPPMGYGYYAKMAEADLDALVAWVRTIPAKE